MARIISFAWTTPALLAVRKTCTRREWSDKYALQLHKGDRLQAWDKSPRSRVGKQVAWIRLTHDPYPQQLRLMPDSDYEAEGFAFFNEHPELLPEKSGPVGVSWDSFEAWRSEAGCVWVVRFEVESLLNHWLDHSQAFAWRQSME